MIAKWVLLILFWWQVVKLWLVAQLTMPVVCFPMLTINQSLRRQRPKLQPSLLTWRWKVLFMTMTAIMLGVHQGTFAAPIAPPVSEILKQGRENINRGRPEQALLDAQRAIKLNNTIAEAYFLLGRAQQDIGLKSDALSSYNKAIALDPRYVSAYSNRGLIKGGLGDMKGAIKDFDRAIEVDKNFAAAYLNRGVASGATGNPRAAMADFNSAIKANPKYTDAYQNRGIARELMGDIKGACADWRTAASMGSVEASKWHTKQCK